MKNRPYWVFTIYFGLVIVLGWLFLFQVNANQRKIKKEDFTTQIDAFFYALNERVTRNIVLLQSINSLFASSNSVSYQEWTQFTQNSNLAEKFPAISWIGKLQVVPADQVASFIDLAQSEGFPNFKIWPPRQAPVYCPMTYIAPQSMNELLGYDFYSNKEEYNFLQKNLNNPDLFVSLNYPGGERKSNSAKRMIYIPSKGTIQNPSKGWIIALLDFSTILEQTEAAVTPESTNITVYSGQNTDLKNLIYQTTTTDNPKRVYSVKRLYTTTGFEWTIVFSSPTLFKTSFTSIIFYLVFLLVLVSLSYGILIYYGYLKQSGSFALENLLEQNIIRCSPHPFIATDLNGVITLFNPAAEKLLGYSADEMVGKKTPEAFHDPEEMKARANELSKMFNKEIKPGFEVFVTIADQNIPEARKWTYIRKDQSRVPVSLTVAATKKDNQEIIGYFGIPLDSTIMN